MQKNLARFGFIIPLIAVGSLLIPAAAFATGLAPECNDSASQTIFSDTSTQDATDSSAAVAVTPHPEWTSLAGATWVYSAPLDVNGSSPTGTKVFTRTFSITGASLDSSLEIATDNMYTVSVNGNPISTGTSATDLNNFSSTNTWPIPAARLIVWLEHDYLHGDESC